MRIICPNCAASYEVDATAIGAAGRTVRCVRCRSSWHQPPITEVAPLIVPAPPAPQHQPAGDASVAAFQSELGNPATEPREPAAAPAVAAAAAPSVTENGDPPGPSLDDLIGVEQADAPSTAEPQPAAEAEEPAAAALADIAIPLAAAPPLAPSIEHAPPDASGDIESTVARRRRRGTARRRVPVHSARMPALILMLVGIVAALIAWRGSIVRQAPQLASLYAAIGLPVNLRGLSFTEVTVSRDTHDGVAVLVVEGSIASTAPSPVEVPRLRFAMRNEAGAEIYAWTAMPTKEALNPGETMPFRSRLASPPGEGKDVTVRFFTRLDAVAGLR